MFNLKFKNNEDDQKQEITGRSFHCGNQANGKKRCRIDDVNCRHGYE